ncbi:MAG TPA: RES family NAD+ phosphorylase [Ferruginibacter sp.]|nr:RES family NAD+ phosphorylase [Ferruginibacter sp.]HNP00692.1 RES family NAD+ phosphorylase [Ferruginibacter sp.]
MITYRISNAAYSNDISGSGAKRMGARWNSKGVPLLYTAQHISLAMLEMLVNTNFRDYHTPLDLMYINLPDPYLESAIEVKNLKKDWRDDLEYTRYIGDAFVNHKESVVLKVPSAVISEEYNFLVNPLHADFRKIRIIKTKSFWPDERLFSI